MSNGFFDIVAPKEFETKAEGRAEKRTVWNKVGRAWPSKSGDSISFEIFLIPNQRYVIHLSDRPKEPREKQSQSKTTANERTFLDDDVQF